MTTLDSTTDTDTLTLTFVAEFDASQERIWQLWVDPRQLERWWGPPTWPATFVDHDPVPGGRSYYYMTGPDGDRSSGWWRFTSLTPPVSLSFDDGFAEPDGTPNATTPTVHCTVTLEVISADPARTRMITVARYDSLEQLEQMMEFGMREGMTEAMGQIEALLLD